MNEPKPCPFCGSTDISYTVVAAAFGYEYVTVKCDACGCRLPSVACKPGAIFDPYREWNRRSGDPSESKHEEYAR